MARIMVVEDEGIVAKDLQRQLQALGHLVPATAGTSEEAIRKAQEVRPELVLMDIHIRGPIDGVETAAQLRASLGIPVVYLTAFADDRTIRRAMEAAPFGYLVKPFNERELCSTIEVALHKHTLERKLHERERWLSTLLDAIGDGVIAVDAEKRVLLLNPVAERITGWTRTEAVGRPIDEVFSAEGPGAAVVGDALAAGEVRFHRKGRLRTRSGAMRDVEESCGPTPGVDGKVAGAVLVFRDVTEERQLQERLVVAERLAALGTLAAGVAHEINNPLAFILSNVSFARETLGTLHAGEAPDAETCEELDEALRETAAGAERVRDIVKDLQIMARPAPGEDKQPTSVYSALERALKFAELELRGRASVSWKRGDVPPVVMEEGQLAQVFINLLINAAQAVPRERGPGQIEIRVRSGLPGRVVVEIADDGMGMAPDVLRRAFDPFFTTKQPGHGTGLGLSVCHGLLSAAGGSISATSEPGKGSVFTVELPAAKRP